MYLSAVVNTEGWRQLGELFTAFGLAFVVGFEREIRQKSAGLRTHTLVGGGAALFVLLSKYGFSDVLEPGKVVLDPSRVAAQIVTGIGFLGAGLIFVRQRDVKGLTTAASVWLTAGIGAAAGAGLPLLAGATTAVYLFIAVAFPLVINKVAQLSSEALQLRVTYPDGQGILRRLLATATELGFVIDELTTEADASHDEHPHLPPGKRMAHVTLQVRGRGSITELATVFSEVPDVHAVVANKTQKLDL